MQPRRREAFDWNFLQEIQKRITKHLIWYVNFFSESGGEALVFGRAQVSFVALLTSLAKRCQQSSKRFNSQCFFSIYKTQKKSFWLLDVALVAGDFVLLFIAFFVDM